MKDYQRLTISLTPEEARALWTDAERGGRIPREQVRFLLRIALGLDEVPPENISQASLLTLRQDVDEFWKIIPDMLERINKLEQQYSDGTWKIFPDILKRLDKLEKQA